MQSRVSQRSAFASGTAWDSFNDEDITSPVEMQGYPAVQVKVRPVNSFLQRD